MTRLHTLNGKRLLKAGSVRHQPNVVKWVAEEILPHEAAVRAWLTQLGTGPIDVDDIVQQTYCALSALGSVEHIANGRAYFFATARSILLQRLRRERVVRFQSFADMEALQPIDAAPCPERTVASRRQLQRVLSAIADLPAPYRQVIELRRLEGLSQKETALRLGTTAKAVENHLARDLRAILKALEADGQDDAPIEDFEQARPRNAARH